jgi:hypothetical protein
MEQTMNDSPSKTDSPHMPVMIAAFVPRWIGILLGPGTDDAGYR